MILRKLTVENYKPFKGSRNFDFTSVDNKNIILIKGQNGAGKTSLFDAVDFVLYGEVPDRIGYHVNALAAKEADPSTGGKTIVKLIYNHDDGKLYELTRTISFDKTEMYFIDKKGIQRIENGAKVTGTDFSASINGEEQLWPDNPADRDKAQKKLVERELPKDAAKYYLFDGEKIKDYTAKPPDKGIQDIIEKLIDVQALDNSENDLNYLNRTNYEKIKRSCNSKIKGLTTIQEKAEKAETKIQDLRNELKPLKSKKKQADEEISKINIELSKKSTIKKILDEANVIKDKIDQAEKDLTKAQQNLAEYNNTGFPGLIAQKLLISISEVMPPKRAEYSASEMTLAEKSLTTDECKLCTQKLDEGAHQHLTNITTQPTNPLDNFNEFLTYFGSSKASLETSTKEWSQKKLAVTTEQTRISVATTELKEITKNLPKNAKSVSDQMEIYANSLQNWESTVKDTENKIEQKQSAINAWQKEYDDAQAEISSVSSVSEPVLLQASVLSKQTKLIEKGWQKIKENVIARQKSQIEKLATQNLQDLTTKPEQYLGIKLDTEIEKGKWALQLELGGDFLNKKTGQPTLCYASDEWIVPSAGERNVIALSYVEALTRFANVQRPVFIDTPFGRLDEKHTYNIAKYYAEKRQQTIILYQPDEIDNKNGASFDQLMSDCARHYELLQSDDNPFETFVEELS